MKIANKNTPICEVIERAVDFTGMTELESLENTGSVRDYLLSEDYNEDITSVFNNSDFYDKVRDYNANHKYSSIIMAGNALVINGRIHFRVATTTYYFSFYFQKNTLNIDCVFMDSITFETIKLFNFMLHKGTPYGIGYEQAYDFKGSFYDCVHGDEVLFKYAESLARQLVTVSMETNFEFSALENNLDDQQADSMNYANTIQKDGNGVSKTLRTMNKIVQDDSYKSCFKEIIRCYQRGA